MTAGPSPMCLDYVEINHSSNTKQDRDQQCSTISWNQLSLLLVYQLRMLFWQNDRKQGRAEWYALIVEGARQAARSLWTHSFCVSSFILGVGSEIGWLALVGLYAVQSGEQRESVKGRFRSESSSATILSTPGMCVAKKVKWIEVFCVVSAAVGQLPYCQCEKECSVLSRKSLTTLQAKILVPAPWLHAVSADAESEVTVHFWELMSGCVELTEMLIETCWVITVYLCPTTVEKEMSMHYSLCWSQNAIYYFHVFHVS